MSTNSDAIRDEAVTQISALGRSVSGESPNKIDALFNALLKKAVVRPTLSVAAESGNTIDVTATLKDGNGDAIAEATPLMVQLFDNNMAAADPAAFRLSVVATFGAIITTTDKGALLMTTNASGIGKIKITDVAGTFVGSVRMVVTTLPADATARLMGAPQYATATFA